MSRNLQGLLHCSVRVIELVSINYGTEKAWIYGETRLSSKCFSRGVLHQLEDVRISYRHGMMGGATDNELMWLWCLNEGFGKGLAGENFLQRNS